VDDDSLRVLLLLDNDVRSLRFWLLFEVVVFAVTLSEHDDRMSFSKSNWTRSHLLF